MVYHVNWKILFRLGELINQEESPLRSQRGLCLRKSSLTAWRGSWDVCFVRFVPWLEQGRSLRGATTCKGGWLKDVKGGVRVDVVNK